MKLRNDKGGEYEIEQVLYTDDIVLVAEFRDNLQHTVNELERECDRIWFKINVGKSKALMVKRGQTVSCGNLRVSGGEMEEVDKFKYLGVMTNGERTGP